MTNEEQDLHQIAYVSRSRLPEDDFDKEVQSILATARSNNPANGVTGALLFSMGFFAQVLEGPVDAVEDLFEIIQLDERHDQVRVLYYRPVSVRAFSDWSMAYAGVVDSEALSEDLRQVFRASEELVTEEASNGVVAVLERLIQRSEASARIRR